jgi:hypothetical protein
MADDPPANTTETAAMIATRPQAVHRPICLGPAVISPNSLFRKSPLPGDMNSPEVAD